MKDGSCSGLVDCLVEGNDYSVDDCIGSVVCLMGICMMDCSSSFLVCQDLSGIDFGSCEKVLGWVVLGGICIVFSGCDAKGYIFYDSSEVCEVVCVDPFA